MGPVQLRYGGIVWQQDLNGSTATTAFPSGASDGVGLPSTVAPGGEGTRVHVALRYQVNSGTASTDIHVYGYAATGATSTWVYIGSLNGGNSITSQVKWGSATLIALAERFALGENQYTRLATRCINPQGNTPVLSTWVGYERF